MSTASSTPKAMTYAGSGVDIDAGDRMVGMIRKHMQRTYGPRVIDQHGGFAGLFRLDYNEKLFQRNYKDPVLVACTDGVGTKVKIAAELRIYDTVGIDLVAMSINDLIVGGAEPLFFLDYLAVHKLDPETTTLMVKGVSEGCVEAGCALLGGETAEMPDVYAEGEFDMAGFAVGVIEKRRLVDGPKRVEAGDVVLGLASSGVHSNGYSLVRAIIRQRKLKLDKAYKELETDKPLGRVLLEPTRIYAKSVLGVLSAYRVKKVVSAMAHITGGGLVGNLDRVLPATCDAKLHRSTWIVPPVLRFLQSKGGVEQHEMDRVFNNGVGYCLVVRPDFAASVMERLSKSGETCWRIGTIVKGTGKVQIV